MEEKVLNRRKKRRWVSALRFDQVKSSKITNDLEVFLDQQEVKCREGGERGVGVRETKGHRANVRKRRRKCSIFFPLGDVSLFPF